jgi:PPOX class probable F420-dependent enzyme
VVVVPRVRELTDELVAFWRERHLCTVTSLRADGSPHVVPMGVVVDVEARVAWAITSRTSQKVANLRRNPVVAVCQVDGRRWSTLEGRAEVRDDEGSVSEAVSRYAERYRQPRPNDQRVALRIELTSVIGNI